MTAPASPIHIGLSLGRLDHWQHGLGEFSRQLGLALAARAVELRQRRGWQFHFHLPAEFHGVFGDDVAYLAVHSRQRWWHRTPQRFALWHRLHQHNRLHAPLGTVRTIETVHDLNFLYAKKGLRLHRYRHGMRRRLAHCDAAVAISRYVADDLRRELAPLSTPLHVIHNGATDLTTAPRQPVPELVGRPYLLHISRMSKSKNVGALLDLAAAWPQRHLVLAGPASGDTDEVRRVIDARCLGNVTLCLNVPEPQKAWLYAHCDAFLFPSITEGFGLPPIEAMYFGKSVFLSRLTSLPEVGGRLAHYFEEFGAASMQDVIEAGLAADAAPGRPAAIRAHAGQFDWSRCAEAHIALYAECLQSPDCASP